MTRRDDFSKVNITAVIVRETAMAILVRQDDDHEEWLPLSQVSYDGEVGEVSIISMPEWLAEDRGLA